MNDDEEWELNEQRAIDAFFLWIVVNSDFSKNGKLAATDIKCEYSDNGKRLNTEDLCKFMWEDICISKNEWGIHARKTRVAQKGTSLLTEMDTSRGV